VRLRGFKPGDFQSSRIQAWSAPARARSRPA
jgi:hypothetical protein